ncbi:MAG: flagellar hook-basal body complex protein FliE [Deltaproteobacteria bacterium]|nr:flagellar hook-basal body complex protein FliE [Deltaproteobacteria bacterium]
MVDTKITGLRDIPLVGRDELAPSPLREAPGGGFGQVLADKLGEVEHMQKEADQAVKSFALGNGEGLQEAVVALEKASLSFELMMKVRGKIVEAYQDIMRMPV